MANYLNLKDAQINFSELKNSKLFVDKSNIIKLLNEKINTPDKYICVTKPRRFGKTSIVNMLSAYYTKNLDSKELFKDINIFKCGKSLKHINKYNVIKINLSSIQGMEESPLDYVKVLEKTIRKDILNEYKIENEKEYPNLGNLIQQTGEKFIFILDEWDYIFTSERYDKIQEEYLDFLRNLLKDRPYVALCYMTGVLPIKKYSSGSALNMFDEFTFLKDRIFGEYFGFTQEEVKKLCESNKLITFDEIERWYNGYQTALGERIYNPRSVVKALLNSYCESYWTNTGPMDEVLVYLKYNTLEIKDDVIQMVSGESIDITIGEEFRAGQKAPKTKEEIYSAMIVLGFLSYYDGYLKIPNKELMKEFEKALRDESFGYVSKIIEKSREMLKATVNKNENMVEKLLHEIHNSEIPILQYNDENSLSCVVTLAYLTARDNYRVEREEKTGKGYADFTFHPRRRNDIAFIVELKKDEHVDVAISQIKEKEYVEKFLQENSSKEILAVAICYNSKKKEHKCKIERI